MPTSYKVLGQSAPSVATSTAIYTCPASTQTVVSTISISNRGNSESTFRISVRPDGETLADKHYIAYDAPIFPNDTITMTIGITLDASDVIDVYAGSSSMSFSVFGSEIT